MAFRKFDISNFCCILFLLFAICDAAKYCFSGLNTAYSPKHCGNGTFDDTNYVCISFTCDGGTSPFASRGCVNDFNCTVASKLCAEYNGNSFCLTCDDDLCNKNGAKKKKGKKYQHNNADQQQLQHEEKEQGRRVQTVRPTPINDKPIEMKKEQRRRVQAVRPTPINDKPIKVKEEQDERVEAERPTPINDDPIVMEQEQDERVEAVRPTPINDKLQQQEEELDQSDGVPRERAIPFHDKPTLNKRKIFAIIYCVVLLVVGTITIIVTIHLICFSRKNHF